MTTTPLAVEATGLVKTFGSNRAVDGVDLRVEAGTVYGVLGPNGAGKTTTISMLATLLRPDGGEARVFGHDVRREPQTVRSLIGVTGQYASVDETLSATENLVIFARLLGLSRGDAKRKAHELLERFGLTEAASRPLKAFSGGMRRRLDLAASLIAQPPLIFLDEPTTGLDPRTRAQMWDTIRELVATGSTVLLGTPAVVSPEGARLTAPMTAPDRVTDLLVSFRDAGVSLAEMSVQKPTLDEVFLTITGAPADADTATTDRALEGSLA